MHDQMSDVAKAFAFVSRVLKINGRRKLRAELEIHMRLIRPEPVSQARRTWMEKRSARRKRIKDLRKGARVVGRSEEWIRNNIFFRPVVGYLGLPAPDHKDTINAMKYAWLHRNDPKPTASVSAIVTREEEKKEAA